MPGRSLPDAVYWSLSFKGIEKTLQGHWRLPQVICNWLMGEHRFKLVDQFGGQVVAQAPDVAVRRSSEKESRRRSLSQFVDGGQAPDPIMAKERVRLEIDQLERICCRAHDDVFPRGLTN